MHIKTGLIVEDQLDSQAWLHNLLLQAFPDIVVARASSLQEARHQLQQQAPPDIALIDLGLPDGSGIDLIYQLTAAKAITRCVVTSIFDDDRHLFTALRAGACGYILKDQAKTDLIPMLQGIVDDKPPLSPAVARRLLQFFQTITKQQPEEDQAQLTKREIDVLTLISKGYTIAKAAELLGITRHTAAGYTKNIYHKLNVSSRAEAALEASRRGIISIDTF